jgi:5'-methylthioadenosine phosphorylase
MQLPEVNIGVFGGSGFYSLLSGAKSYAVHTPYGNPSDRFTVGELNGIGIAFLPRSILPTASTTSPMSGG